MKFTYNNYVYCGTREEIKHKISVDLWAEHMWFCDSKSVFTVGEERYVVSCIGSANTHEIKNHMIKAALAKVPDDGYTYDGKTYTGTKIEILTAIVKHLKNDFTHDGNIEFSCGEEKYTNTHRYPIDIVALHGQLINQAVDKVENEI